MKKSILLILLTFIFLEIEAQDPAVTSWLQNTTETGSYYNAGNPTAIDNGILVNCQKVEFNGQYVYVTTEGIPSYPTGPFSDGNPSQASAQDQIYRFPLNPQENTGTPTSTTPGNIGVFINGVSLFDYRDGVAWNPTTNNICGGPGNPPCPGGPAAVNDWNRDAIPAEREGFDCSKGHPAMGNYHHHQNPSAFKLDLNVIYDICNLYDADGLYTINDSEHSPLIGYAYDGFPIYGAYGYKNADGSGGITRIKSSYQLKNITTRPNGPDVDQVVTLNGNQHIMFLGYFREDYEYVAQSEEDYVDEHNGRFCVTPEYPNGTYAYFATVDENWNSAYPYVVGPTFYGVYSNASVTTVPSGTTIYTPTSTSLSEQEFNELDLNVFPNPASDLITIQVNGLLKDDLKIELMDITGKLIQTSKISSGSTISYLDVQTVYNGTYMLRITNGMNSSIKKILIAHD